MITTKNIRETDRYHAHTDVYKDGTYIGYIIKNDSMAAAVGENWNFVSAHPDYPFFHAKTKKSIITQLS